jgi:hypothetical protein
VARKSTNPLFRHERAYPRPPFESGPRGLLLYWYNTRQGGEPNEVALEYRVMTKRGWVTVVSYEGDKQGRFYRRGPGWPEPGGRSHGFEKVPMKQRRALALADIEENARKFHDVVPVAERGEVEDG